MTEMIFNTILWYVIADLFNTIFICKEWNAKQRWFTIHFIFNMINVVFTFPDMIDLFANPLAVEFKYGCVHPSCLVMALHVYHGTSFNLNYIDKLHHSVMCSLLLFPYIFSGFPYVLSYSNAAMFFICGLPGGIDYFMMAYTAFGFMDPINEKRINMFLNTWIRSIGIMFCVFTLYINYIYGHFTNLPVTLITMNILTWNAQYFSQETAVSYGRTLK